MDDWEMFTEHALVDGSGATAVIAPRSGGKSELWRRSKSGYEFDFNANIWRLDGLKKIDWARLPAGLEVSTVEGFRKTLARFAEELSANFTSNILNWMLMYLRSMNTPRIDADSLMNYRASLSRENEWKLGSIRSFLMAWIEWGHAGVGSDVEAYLETLALCGNIKGKAIRDACPHSGPYTDLELGAIYDEVANLFQKGAIKLFEFAFFTAVAMTGRRPVQILQLRYDDLRCRAGKKSEGDDYRLRIPRAKQRNTGFREAFKAESVNEDLHHLLRAQGDSVIRAVEEWLGVKLSQKQRALVPLFPHRKRIGQLKSIGEFELRAGDTPDWWHATTNTGQLIFARIGRLNTAHSERTGDYIQFSPRRFRYTKGTNLVRRGISGAALAMALDHSDTQSIDVYVKNTAEEARAISEIMAPAMAPLAQAFAGQLIVSERNALRANDPNSRIKNGNLKATGNCGNFRFCASGYRTCYTCVNFQPWVDGPHETVLAELVEERERQRKNGISEHVIQSTDRTLLAVTEVIQMCRERARNTNMVDVSSAQ